MREAGTTWLGFRVGGVGISVGSSGIGELERKFARGGGRVRCVFSVGKVRLEA